jgi:chromosome partitioning protein
MTYILGVLSQKGGVGKSTIARLLAVELAKEKFSVKIADLDTQQTTSTDWSSDRYENSITPEIQVQPFGNLKTAIKESNNFDIYILDGKPHSSSQTVEIAKASDIIIIPTGQTKDDLRPSVTLAHSLVNSGIEVSKVCFALVKTTNSKTEISAALHYLKQTEYYVLSGCLPISTAYATAHDQGKAVTETSYHTLNIKAKEIAQSIIDRLSNK